MSINKLLFLSLCFALSFSVCRGQNFNPGEHKILTTDRADGRYISTRGVVQYLMETTEPRLAFEADFQSGQFKRWQKEVRAEMELLIKHPCLKNLPAAQKVSSVQREGYRSEKWEIYPLPGCVTAFYVLIPDSLPKEGRLPTVLCISGSGQTKESLAGEPDITGKFRQRAFPQKNAMALYYVKQGLIAVAVDNPCTGETSDLERYAPMYYDYETSSRFLLEMGWSYLGYTSYLDMQILGWMKEQPFIEKERIIVSGFSLGTEPLMVLGVLDPSIYAFVYNDFLCRTRERAIVMSMPDKKGYRPYPNSIRHLIPGFLCNFDFPDLVAALAPRPLICTEGGLDRDFRLVSRAYEIAGKKDNFTYYHDAGYADPEQRKDLAELPKGLDGETYFRLVNVEPGQHYFKEELAIPWLNKLLNREK